MNDLEKLNGVFSRFLPGAPLAEAAPHGGGLINSSWLVQAGDGQRFLLQRVNTRVFREPRQMMANILQVTGHLQGLGEPTLEFLPLAADPQAFLHEEEGVWRLCRFIENARPAGRLAGPRQAAAAGRAYGRFLQSLADFPAPQLHATLPGFHDTPARWTALLQAFHDDRCGRAAEVELEMQALFDRADLAQGLLRLDLPVRVTHNDAKLGNVLLAAGSDDPLCVVDLDTVMPGSALHDFGDMVRTMCCLAGEEETDLDLVEAEPGLLAALAEGWLAEVDPILTPAERLNLLPAGLVIIFEQAVRFLTDHLEGDVYYSTACPGQNLDRARNQLQLLVSIIEQREEMAAVLP